MLWILACAGAVASAVASGANAGANTGRSVQGYIANFGPEDTTTTTVHLDDLEGHVRSEPASSSGNFTFFGVAHGQYELRLVSTTLQDRTIYSVIVDDDGIETLRRGISSHLEQPAGYPIKLGATRGPDYAPPPKPRLYELYTDTTVLVAFGALLLLNILPQVWQDMSAEDLKVLEGQEGLASAFETAHKIASSGR